MARMPRQHLASVPDTPPRAVAYIRVSTEREDMVSPEIQAAAIAEHCAKHGYQLVSTLEDLDLTGKFWKRRQVEQAIGMIEAGDADVLVVWKISRVARNRLDWNIAVDRVETVGGKLESATEPLDTSTSTGRFARGMLAELAAFESERIGETWREAHMRRLRAGLPHSGKAKWGYTYDKSLKMHVPDPELAPILADLYRRYVAGESFYTLVRWLNDNGYRTIEGNLWRDSVLRRTLDSGFAAGRITYGGREYDGIHETVITPAEWRAYRAQRAKRRSEPARTKRSQYLLSGLIKCHCGSSMTAGQYGHARQPKYRCQDSKERGAHGGGGYIMAAFVEGAVIDWLRQLAAELDDTPVTLDLAASAAKRQKVDVQRLAREINALDKQLAELTRQLIAGVVSDAAYQLTAGDIERDKAALMKRLEEAQLSVDTMPVNPAQASRELLDVWDVASVELRRNALKDLIAKVIVTPGRPRGTVQIVPVWVG